VLEGAGSCEDDEDAEMFDVGCGRWRMPPEPWVGGQGQNLVLAGGSEASGGGLKCSKMVDMVVPGDEADGEWIDISCTATSTGEIQCLTAVADSYVPEGDVELRAVPNEINTNEKMGFGSRAIIIHACGSDSELFGKYHPHMSYALSQSTFESLLPAIVAILKLTQPQPPGTAAQQQEIAKATMALRSQLANARELVDALPGGEMLLEHQHEVIAMLIGMRDARRAQLARLSDLSLGSRP